MSSKKAKKPETVQDARPFVKWVGGKRQLVPELLARLPDGWRADRDPYAELFVGSGALYFALRPTLAQVNDVNKELATCWMIVRDNPDSLIRQLGALQKRYVLAPQSTYYEVRSWKPGLLDDVTRSARFIFLNKTGFNGLYRVNRAGEFNTPWGQNPRVNACDAENIHRCSEVMRWGRFSVWWKDFEDFGDLEPGTLVYLDPPYKPRSATANFRGFNPVKFSIEDHRRLAAFAARMSRSGCHVMVSQSEDDEIAELYSSHGFKIDVVQAVRKVNSTSHGRGPVGELIITRRAA